MASSFIAKQLTQMAENQPNTLAVTVQQKDGSFKEYTYQTLDRTSNQVADALLNIGVRKGTRVVVMERPGFHFFSVVFALFRIGAVLVAIDPGLGLKGLKQCIAEAEPQVFIGNIKAHMARVLFGWGKDSIETRILTTPLFFPIPGTISLSKLDRHSKSNFTRPVLLDVEDDGMAAILFTSGSTGIPKGAVYSHSNFHAQIYALKNCYDIQQGEVDLATFPLFALYAPAMGMTSVIPYMDFTRPGKVDPPRLAASISRYGATTMFGSPALLDRFGRWATQLDVKFSTLKRVLSAGAPVSPQILERFTHLVAGGVEIYTPYGATEALPVCSIGSREVLNDTRGGTDQGLGICVGKPVEDIEVYIIRITDDVIERWDSKAVLSSYSKGEIVVSGPQVTSAYYNRPHETRNAKIINDSGKLYHRMGDTGYIDESGRLWFCGRKSHCVHYDDEIYFSICCEGVFNVHDQVFRSALIGLRQDGKTVPALCVELETGQRHADKNQIREELLKIGSQYQHTRPINDIFFHPAFPVDIRHNAKINRTQLASWAEEQTQ
jgi:acyl-CoA synthetase (AMP-forming)/AMP-acid ligase II